MPSIARAVQRFKPAPAEGAYLEGRLRLIFEGGSTDARGFSSANLDIVSRAADLQVADREIGVPNWYLMDALRDYLLAQLKGPRCADSVTEPMVPSTFNAALRRIGADQDVTAIDNAAARPSRILGGARIDLYWQTLESRRLYEAEHGLHGPGSVPRPLKERQTAEWTDAATLFLTSLEQWTGAREPAERDFFYEKSVLFTGLIDLIPSGVLHTRAVRAHVEFLRRANMDRDGRALWFAMLNRFLEMARGASRLEILAALEDSHHPTLSLYAKLERATPASRADTQRPTDESLARRSIPAASPSS